MYVLEVLCYIKQYKGDLKHIARTMNITQEVNMTFTHSLTIHLYSKIMCYIWVWDCTKACTWGSNNLIISTNLEKKWNWRCWITRLIQLKSSYRLN